MIKGASIDSTVEIKTLGGSPVYPLLLNKAVPKKKGTDLF
jgi:hypothetical protein